MYSRHYLIASRYIYEFLIITYVSTLLSSGLVFCVLFVIQSAPKFGYSSTSLFKTFINTATTHPNP